MVIAISGFKIVTAGDEKAKNMKEMKGNIFSVGNQKGQNPVLFDLFLLSPYLHGNLPLSVSVLKTTYGCTCPLMWSVFEVQSRRLPKFFLFFS